MGWFGKTSCPAPGDTSVFRERGGAEGIRRVEIAATGQTREQGMTKAGTSATMLPPVALYRVGMFILFCLPPFIFCLRNIDSIINRGGFVHKNVVKY